MSAATDTSSLIGLLQQAGRAPIGGVERLARGGNNRIFVAETDRGPVVVKEYFHHPDDPRDRLAAEFGFSRFAWAHGVRNIPQPLAAEPSQHVAAYTFVDGQRPEAVDDGSVAAAMAFFEAINAHRHAAAALPMASEACFSIGEHLERVDGRVARLASVTDDEARAFVRDRLAPGWQRVRRGVLERADRLGMRLEHVLPPTECCVSPSDFGFHNALVDADGRYTFLDFEYAGWDDPAKLVCDFFCQPERPVDGRYFERFIDAVTRAYSQPSWHARRVRLLWPAYEVKWACILLNEFLSVGRRRRQFAGMHGQSVSDSRARVERAGRRLNRAILDADGLLESCR